MHPAAGSALLLLGLAPPALVVLYYMVTLSFNPVSLAWSGVLMIAGGQVGPVQAVEMEPRAGQRRERVRDRCLARAPRPACTRRSRSPFGDPVTYAGPGSLGGTDSALEHRSPALRR